MSHPKTQSQEGPGSCETALINPHNTSVRSWHCRRRSVARQTQVQYSTEDPLGALRHSDLSSTKPHHILVDLRLVFIYSFTPALAQPNNVSLALLHCRASGQRNVDATAPAVDRLPLVLAALQRPITADGHVHMVKEITLAVTLETGFHIWLTKKSQAKSTASTIFTLVGQQGLAHLLICVLMDLLYESQIGYFI